MLLVSGRVSCEMAIPPLIGNPYNGWGYYKVDGNPYRRKNVDLDM